MRGRTPLARMHAVRLDGVAGNNVSTPDHADLDITGDVDLRVALILGKNPPLANGMPLTKWNPTGAQRSYRMNLLSTGIPRVEQSTVGTDALSIAATVVLPPLRVLLVKETLDVDNGAAGRDGTFALKPYRPGAVLLDLKQDFGWRPHGTNPQTIATAVNTFSGTAALSLSGNIDGSAMLPCRIIAAVIKNGIDGTTVAEFDASRMRVGDRTYTDRFGKVWTLNGNAHIEAA